MYSQCSTYDGNDDLHDAPTRSYCSVAPQVKQAAFSSMHGCRGRPRVGHVPALEKPAKGESSTSASFGVWNSDRLHNYIFYYVRRVLVPPPDMSLSALSPPPKCHFIYTYIAVKHP